MNLTAPEIRIILDVLRAKYGLGYSENKSVGTLQAKLSILLELAQHLEEKGPIRE